MKRIALLLAAALPATAAAAQTPAAASLRVHVDDDRGRPLPHAQVTIGGVNALALTDAGGNARIDHVPPGNRLVQVSHPGYAFVRVPADFDSTAVERSFRMTPDPVELPGITVTSWGRSMHLRNVGFYDRQKEGLGRFMTGDELRAFLPLNTNQAFERMRGFRLEPSSGTDMVVVTTRGMADLNDSSTRCFPLIYVDGALMAVRSERDQADLFREIPPDDVAGIEAYPSPATIPAQYNVTGSACGVVLIWTRSGEDVVKP